MRIMHPTWYLQDATLHILTNVWFKHMVDIWNIVFNCVSQSAIEILFMYDYDDVIYFLISQYWFM